MYRHVIQLIGRAPSKALIAFIALYQRLVSRWIPGRCRFSPSCSEYAKSALQARGVFCGVFLILWRIVRCHPGHPGGYDPVPIAKNKVRNGY